MKFDYIYNKIIIFGYKNKTYKFFEVLNLLSLYILINIYLNNFKNIYIFSNIENF